MNEATLLCDYVALLNKGKLVEQGAPSELKFKDIIKIKRLRLQIIMGIR